MRILLEAYTGDKSHWTEKVVELARLPYPGELIEVKGAGDGEAEWYRVLTALLVADDPDCVAKLHCKRAAIRRDEAIIWDADVFMATKSVNPKAPASTTMPSALERSSSPVKFLTELQAARELQVSRQTVRRLINNKRLDATDVGTASYRIYRVTPEALARLAHPGGTQGIAEEPNSHSTCPPIETGPGIQSPRRRRRPSSSGWSGV